MANADNVRVLYQDGLILGADELAGDQSYFRAALERRSLTRDAFGIAWGLELEQVKNTILVKPGVAYGGDGKVIVVRQTVEVISRIKSQLRVPSPAMVYLTYAESSDRPKNVLSFCGQATDPRVVEDFDIEFGDPPPFNVGQREGARVEPHVNLGGPGDATKSRVALGVIKKLDSGDWVVDPNSPRDTFRDAPAPVAGTVAPIDSAQYIGVLASSVVHPWAWEAGRGGQVKPAIELDPRLGVTFHHEAIFREHVIFQSGAVAYELRATEEEREKQQAGTLQLNAVGAGTSKPKFVVGDKVPLEIRDNLAVRGQSAFTGEALFSDGVTMKGRLDVDGKVTCKNLLVIEDAEFKGKVTTTGTINLEGDLTLGGDNKVVTIKGTTTLTGPTTFEDTATFKKGIKVVAGAAELTQGATVSNGLTVNGAANLTGGASVAGNLAVTGTATAATLSVSGAANANSANVTGEAKIGSNATVGGTLTVGGASTVNDLTINGRLSVPSGFAGAFVHDFPAAAGVTKGTTVSSDGSAVKPAGADDDPIVGVCVDILPGNIARVAVAGKASARFEATGSVKPGAFLLMKAGTPGVLTNGAAATGKVVGKYLGADGANALVVLAFS
ncbi:hypothetical protein LZC95_21190 [Pendulispora brunnea]|uniref:Uncharacterized protein n=1 Tax=Pendulispora brunnea TaxID=2905690 RepID=A0ABZ2KPS6_9BACT